MRAAQLVSPGRFEVLEVPDPIPDDGEVLVAMERSSICGSDLHVAFDPAIDARCPLAPGLPGHEGVGRVLDSRSGRFCEGDLVLTVPMPGRGACYATKQVVGEDFLVGLDKDADLDRVVMAQQLGTVVYGFRRYWPRELPAGGRTAAILGAGSAGLFALQLARLAGFEVVAIADLVPTRLDIARRLGARAAVRAPDESFVDAVLESTAGLGADLVIEAVGLDSCRAQCVAAVARAGRIGLFGLPERAGSVPFPIALAFARACTIEMAGNAQLEPGLESFREAIDLITGGRVDVEDMVAARFPLTDIQRAFDLAHERRAVKVTVWPRRTDAESYRHLTRDGSACTTAP